MSTSRSLDDVRRVAPRQWSGPPAHVCVVVPCFNYARFLPEAVGSALGQDGVEVEVIVVDDASTDDSLAVARSLAESDSRVRVLAHERNAGPVATFNDGLALATGEFLVRLDADDLLTPGSLRRSVDVVRALPTVGLVYGRPIHFHEHRPAPRSHAREWTLWPGVQWLADRCTDGFNVITSPEAFMRMSVVQQVGGQRPLAHTHDMEMWLRLAAFADVAYIAGADQAWHRDHAVSLSAREVDRSRDLRERLDAFKELGAGVARERPGVQELVARARASVAVDALRMARHERDRRPGVRGDVDALLAVALEADPTIVSTRLWAQASGVRRSHLPFRVRGWAESVRNRGRWWHRQRTWQRTGTWGVVGAVPGAGDARDE